jgi:hypothetical protein
MTEIKKRLAMLFLGVLAERSFFSFLFCWPNLLPGFSKNNIIFHSKSFVGVEERIFD